MDLKKILKSLENCPCGRVHTFDTEIVEIESGITSRTGEILKSAGFEKNILVVADNNTIVAAHGVLDSLETSGFTINQLIYENMKYAMAESVEEVKSHADDVDGIISVGTGSLNDICRVASFELKKKFCIFATAPSMDGFASDTAPIIKNGFKASREVAQPSVIIADTKILAKAPSILKSSGFGDMIAKYIGLVDWEISRLISGEYYCEKVAAITKAATDKIVSLADRVTEESEEAAGAIMESLIMTGLAMKLARSSRPASGAEHIISHYLECHKVLDGIWPDYHGRKVAVGTVYCNRIYRSLAEKFDTITCTEDKTDWSEVYAHYAPELHPDIKKLNEPTVTEKIDPRKIESEWQNIRKVIFDLLPDDDTLLKLMKKAGAPTTPEEVDVSREFLNDAIRYHSYMRHRITLMRILPMMGIDPIDYI